MELNNVIDFKTHIARFKMNYVKNKGKELGEVVFFTRRGKISIGKKTYNNLSVCLWEQSNFPREKKLKWKQLPSYLIS